MQVAAIETTLASIENEIRLFFCVFAFFVELGILLNSNFHYYYFILLLSTCIGDC